MTRSGVRPACNLREHLFGVVLLPLALLSLPACASLAQTDQSAGVAPVGSEEGSLVLLGTAGGPGAMPGRAGISSLLIAGGNLYMIDAGEGVSRQLALSGHAERDVHRVFLTHLHDDHTAGLPALATFHWTLGGQEPLRIMGPPRTTELVEGLLSFMRANAEIRMQERGLPSPAERITGSDLGTGLVYEDGKVRVFALENTHFHLAANGIAAGHKSYSYRFETAERTIVFTGDTGPSTALVQFAAGADMLVAEMVAPADIAHVPPAVVPHMLEEHLTTETLGQLAQQAGVQTVIISHNRAASAADVDDVRRHFSGEVILGNDLQRF